MMENGEDESWQTILVHGNFESNHSPLFCFQSAVRHWCRTRTKPREAKSIELNLFVTLNMFSHNAWQSTWIVLERSFCEFDKPKLQHELLTQTGNKFYSTDHRIFSYRSESNKIQNPQKRASR